MAPEMITGLFNLGSSIIGGVTNAFGQSSANRMAERQMAEQIRQNDIAFNRQRQLIKEQNEYNSPANQARLMKEAGLNPMLMYQHGTQSIQSEIAQPIAPEAPLLRGTGEIAADSVNKGLSTLLNLAQLDVLKSQANKNNADATGKEIENKYSEYEILQRLRQGEVNIQVATTNIDQMLANIANTNAVTRNLSLEYNLTEVQIDKLEAELTTEQLTQAKMLLEQEGIKANNDLIRKRAVAQELDNSLFALRQALMEVELDFTRQDALLKQWEVNYRSINGTPPNQNVYQYAVDSIKWLGRSVDAGVGKLKNWVNKNGDEWARRRAESTTD